ncbi:DUF2946 domain-containing protein [Ralstonia solanacearum]|uniref:DUF2946 domain-containing protein n=1 Tax=Ralstonia solanacearum TaxID=305 RepID=UPI00018168F3|nr:DUF2946 domain-containing protein [Ralstonia solanacearum]MDC6176375.1 DUF2946 domain-containing protein [Ralstonia solanacearum]MDC6209408.1 DUF2946 domain-containing protein [Ralstonia solanacearum]MDC6237534.1 DUF2946 domain-containing protein [Ralstonia solanacearum]MDD7799814.1 DUF2946 domain-containing protein [Ralstonia solanacearum]TYZ55601.1 DUF2946 domain-containing protein [Ralstonia solanacearum]
MHFARTRTRLTAWLGLVAMALAFFAPVVSQQLALHPSSSLSGQVLPYCTATPVASAGSDLPGHGLPTHHHAACGYCDLLAHHVPAPAPAVRMAVPVPAYGVAWVAASERFAVREVRRAGRPRDSPFLA